ncbi:MAG: ATP-binding protein, partial [Salinibacter sp.]
RMLKLDEDELEGQPFEEITHPDDVKLEMSLVDDLREEAGGSKEAERLFVRDNGEVFWGSLTVSPHEGPSTTQLIGMIEDIDEKKRQKQKLKEAKTKAEEMSRLKSAFLANMSHEIRTPLTSILGFAEAIGNADDADEEVPVKEFARRISKSGNRLLETLDSVLDLSRLEAGSMDLSPGPLELTEEVQETVNLLEQRAKTTGVTLQADVPDTPLWVTADQGALRRIQRNLLSNALKYTEDGGQAWIRVYEDDGDAVLEVEDTGIGMEPSVAEDLFEPFRQASEGLDREYEGTGVGLAVTQKTVEQMGGTIEVETEMGEGSCFIVRLPRTDPKPADEEDRA